MLFLFKSENHIIVYILEFDPLASSAFVFEWVKIGRKNSQKPLCHRIIYVDILNSLVVNEILTDKQKLY